MAILPPRMCPTAQRRGPPPPGSEAMQALDRLVRAGGVTWLPEAPAMALYHAGCVVLLEYLNRASPRARGQLACSVTAAGLRLAGGGAPVPDEQARLPL